MDIQIKTKLSIFRPSIQNNGGLSKVSVNMEWNQRFMMIIFVGCICVSHPFRYLEAEMLLNNIVNQLVSLCRCPNQYMMCQAADVETWMYFYNEKKNVLFIATDHLFDNFLHRANFVCWWWSVPTRSVKYSHWVRWNEKAK